MGEVLVFLVIAVACVAATLGGLLLLGLFITACYGAIVFGAKKGKDLVHTLGLY